MKGYKLSLEEIENGYIVTRPMPEQGPGTIYREKLVDALQELRIGIQNIQTEINKVAQEKD